MDPLTTLLAAAAATGPNTFQSQALTALRSAGPQESFFTRMGNPHPLQMQQLAQPTTPQLAPIITQPTMAPTAFTQPLSMPAMPMASPMADPAPGALHLPTLQAIHRMQQQASPAPALVPTMPQLPTTQPTATMPRDPMEYTQTNFPALTPRQLAVLAQLETQDQQALRSSAHNVLQPACRRWQGDLHKAWERATHSPPAPQPAFWRQDKTHSSVLHRSHTQHHEGRDRRAVCHLRIAAEATPGHNIDATADPEATAGTADHAAVEHAGHTDTDPGPPGPDPQAITAVIGRLCYAADPSLASCNPLASEKEQANPRGHQWR